jgi:hypothetical protein
MELTYVSPYIEACRIKHIEAWLGFILKSNT